MDTCPFCAAPLDHTLDDAVFHAVYACETVLAADGTLTYTPHGLDGPMRQMPAERED